MDEINIKDQLAKNITLLRKSRNFNQNELGEKLGYSDKSVSKWELKESIPDIETIAKIAKLFDVTVDQLIYSHNIVRKSNRKKNHRLITLLSMCGPFLLAALLFLVLAILEVKKAYIVWIAAISLSGVVGVVFSAIWYKPIHLTISSNIIIWPFAVIVMILLNFKYWWAVLIVAFILSVSLAIGFKITPIKKDYNN